MSPKIATLPPNEPAMWRKLLAAAHPDRNGDHDLFIWASNVRETVCSNASEKSGTWTSPSYSQSTRAKPASSTVDDSDAVPFDSEASGAWDHESLTEKAYSRAGTEPEPYAHLLRLLRDCDYVFSGSAYKQQSKGATLKQLAAIGYAIGMSTSQRIHWYRIAEDVPLSRRHAGHILSRLKRAA